MAIKIITQHLELMDLLILVIQKKKLNIEQQILSNYYLKFINNKFSKKYGYCYNLEDIIKLIS